MAPPEPPFTPLSYPSGHQGLPRSAGSVILASQGGMASQKGVCKGSQEPPPALPDEDAMEVETGVSDAEGLSTSADVLCADVGARTQLPRNVSPEPYPAWHGRGVDRAEPRSEGMPGKGNPPSFMLDAAPHCTAFPSGGPIADSIGGVAAERHGTAAVGGRVTLDGIRQLYRSGQVADHRDGVNPGGGISVDGDAHAGNVSLAGYGAAGYGASIAGDAGNVIHDGGSGGYHAGSSAGNAALLMQAGGNAGGGSVSAHDGDRGARAISSMHAVDTGGDAATATITGAPTHMVTVAAPVCAGESRQRRRLSRQGDFITGGIPGGLNGASGAGDFRTDDGGDFTMGATGGLSGAQMQQPLLAPLPMVYADVIPASGGPLSANLPLAEHVCQVAPPAGDLVLTARAGFEDVSRPEPGDLVTRGHDNVGQVLSPLEASRAHHHQTSLVQGFSSMTHQGDDGGDDGPPSLRRIPSQGSTL
eukprot:jgi/Mesvir1/13596/Mv06780-RA.1